MTNATAATPPRRTECPQCGTKLPDIPVSLCPYCASPLETAADRKKLESVNASRIKRVSEHKDFADAEAWTPPESVDWHRAAQKVWWMMPTVVLGALVLFFGVLPPLGRGFDLGGIFLSLVAGGIIGLGLYLGATGRKAQAKALERPLMRRAGLIVDRRSETEVSGWGGRTTYFFKIELEDGVVGEFRFPGLGAQEDPYATNLPGMAYTRGPELLHFRHIRV